MLRIAIVLFAAAVASSHAHGGVGPGGAVLDATGKEMSPTDPDFLCFFHLTVTEIAADFAFFDKHSVNGGISAPTRLDFSLNGICMSEIAAKARTERCAFEAAAAARAAKNEAARQRKRLKRERE